MELKIIDPMEDLYRAAYRGDVETLKQLLLQPNAPNLGNIPDRETNPLHIQALLGHVGVTEVLLNHNQDLAIRADSSGRTALHLASTAANNLQTVQTLLQFNNQPCLFRDEKGRIPLHYAAMRGRTEVVQELIKARPESLCPHDKDKNPVFQSLCPHDEDKTTVFHLCVTYNHLETLETLVKLDYATVNITTPKTRSPIFTLPDHAGNTILHLAIKFKRVEVVRYLLSIPEMRQLKKKKNREGLTALDILKGGPKDWKIDEIKLILAKDDMEESGTSMLKCIGNCFMKIFEWIGNKLNPVGSVNWLEVMRGNLSAASIFIATISFQALINPPADFIQKDSSSSQRNSFNLSPSQYNPEEKVFKRFQTYVDYITLCFYASICVTLLLVSGVPLQNSATIWMLSMGMSLTLYFLSAAYDTAAEFMVDKRRTQLSKSIVVIGSDTFGSPWNAVLGLVVGFYTLRFVIWIARKCYRIIKKLVSCCCCRWR